MDELKEYKEREAKRQKRIEDCTEELTAVLKKYYGELPKKGEEQGMGALDTLDAPKVLARIMHLFDIGDPGTECLYLEWMVDKFVRIEVEKFLPWAEEIYKILKERSHTKENPFVYNDLDCRAFFIPHEKYDIFCHEDQNCSFIYRRDHNSIWNSEFRICRYWDEYVPEENEEDDYALGKWKEGVEISIANSDWWVQRFSDNLAGNDFIHRPDLKWYEEKDFEEIGYGDCRDGFTVINYRAELQESDRGVMSRMGDIWLALFNVSTTITALKEAIGDFKDVCNCGRVDCPDCKGSGRAFANDPPTGSACETCEGTGEMK